MKFPTVLQWSVFGQQNVQAMQVCYGLCFKTDHKVVFLYSNSRFYEAFSLKFIVLLQNAMLTGFPTVLPPVKTAPILSTNPTPLLRFTRAHLHLLRFTRALCCQ